MVSIFTYKAFAYPWSPDWKGKGKVMCRGLGHSKGRNSPISGFFWAVLCAKQTSPQRPPTPTSLKMTLEAAGH